MTDVCYFAIIVKLTWQHGNHELTSIKILIRAAVAARHSIGPCGHGVSGSQSVTISQKIRRT